VYLGTKFPGLHNVGGVGSKVTMRASGPPVTPEAKVDVAFRSQRIVSSIMTGTTGRTLEVSVEGEGAARRYTLTNGFAHDVTQAYLLLPGRRMVSFGQVAAGAAASAGRMDDANRIAGGAAPAVGDNAGRASFLARIVAARAFEDYDPPECFHELARAGLIARKPTEKRAILVAFTRDCPFPLPDSEPGTHFVVLTREVEIP
jgi:hypothetical protein